MIKNICKDIEFLKIKSTDCNESDKELFIDMKDTLTFNKAGCLGIAANMIGVSKRAICVFIDDTLTIMVNPRIIKKSNEYKTKEGCLSLEGQRECIRYDKIKVEWYTPDFKKRLKVFEGLNAEVIQHELDHLDGIII